MSLFSVGTLILTEFEGDFTLGLYSGMPFYRKSYVPFKMFPWGNFLLNYGSFFRTFPKKKSFKINVKKGVLTFNQIYGSLYTGRL